MAQGTRAQSEDPLKMIGRAAIKLYSAWVSATYPFAGSGARLSIHYGSDLSKSHAHCIKLGCSVVIEKDALVRVHVPLMEEGEPVIVLEDGCVIDARCTLSAKNYLYLERDVVLGAGVLIQDHSHAYRDVTTTIRQQGVTDGGRIRIGQGSWIGNGAVIHSDQGELTLGRNCVVAPNSLVNRSFPAHSLIAGNPARVVKQFDATKGAWVLGSSRAAETEVVLREVQLQTAR